MTIESITELNTLLMGEHMAIQSYEHFMEQVEDSTIKKTLQKIQQDHKLHAVKIAEQIQNLGGRPANDPPMMAEFMLTLKSLHKKDLASIIKDAYVGQKRGIEKAEEIVKGDLDQNSKNLLTDILHEDTMHLSILKELMNHLDNNTSTPIH
ncbi:ferritin-like domain-containing protein [Dethiobacter alkaliphilus]|nr:ferritin-like domain-containing protein [Dethiobacter alkaliphilus]